MTPYKAALHGAFLTLLTLFGGLLAGSAVGNLVFHLIPGSSVEDVKLGHAAIAAFPALVGFLAGGAAWGVQMGRLAGNTETHRLSLAGMLGFGPVAILLTAGLGLGEPIIVGYLGERGRPVYRVFTLLFVPSAFIIAGVSAWVIGWGLSHPKLARSLFWQVGLTAAFDLFGCQPDDGVPGLGDWCAKRSGTCHHGDSAGTR